jgi:hypothetical protein
LASAASYQESKTMNATLQERIERHGRNLLAIFPDATEQDPVKLCKKLRRLERIGNAIGLRMCNGPEYREAELWAAKERVLTKVQALLGYQTGGVPVILNLDPRGYALKIDDEWMSKTNQHDCGYVGPCTTCPKCVRPTERVRLHRDWGGYGIIAPDLSDSK